MPQVLYQIKEEAGKPFRPSNGDEGIIFEDAFCDRCIKDENQECSIHTTALVCGIDDKDFPKEWIFDADGWPMCTEFEAQ